MTTMDIALFVTLTLNVAMQEKHNYYNMLLQINIRKQLNITRITSNQNFTFLLTRQQQALV